MATVDPAQFGVSFSLKQCRAFGLPQQEVLDWLLHEAGFRRFRLMSYWDEHEPAWGQYDFSALDQQIDAIGRAGGSITLCLGVRQPRWPENHWPAWAWQLSRADRTKALLSYIERVVERYRGNQAIVSYQLENEALLKSFGSRPDIDSERLRREYRLVKQLDPQRPVIMTTSTSWGIPVRQPIPDIVGFSYYHAYFNNRANRYAKAGGHYMLLHRLRAFLIYALYQHPSFIHELQLEPWAPKAIWETSREEQDRSMGPTQIKRSLERAKSTHLYPIDLWGGEWWYWRIKHYDDTSIWHAIQQELPYI